MELVEGNEIGIEKYKSGKITWFDDLKELKGDYSFDKLDPDS